MKIFKTKWFVRFARKEKISDQRLIQAVYDADAGNIDADYGGGVIKQRIARSKEGKSGGYRSIILYRKGEKAFFVFGFAKKEMENIDKADVLDFKRLAKVMFAASDIQIEINAGERRVRGRDLMKKTKGYRSEAAAAIHETAAGLFDAGVIDKRTMREFDESCLTPIHEFTPREIRALREREQVSQTVFAHHLNISKDSISQWERGEKRPAGPSLKLLLLIERKGLAAIA